MYIYIFEDGQVGQCSHPPTEADLSAINDGRLQVLHCEGYVCEVNSDNAPMNILIARRKTREGVEVTELAS